MLEIMKILGDRLKRSIDPEYKRYQESLEEMSTRESYQEDNRYFKAGADFETNEPRFIEKGTSYKQMKLKQGSAYLPVLDGADPLEAEYVQRIFDKVCKEIKKFSKGLHDDRRFVFHEEPSRGFNCWGLEGYFTENEHIYGPKPLSMFPRRPVADAAKHVLEEDPKFEQVKDSWVGYR